MKKASWCVVKLTKTFFQCRPTYLTGKEDEEGGGGRFGSASQYIPTPLSDKSSERVYVGYLRVRDVTCERTRVKPDKRAVQIRRHDLYEQGSPERYIQ